jgi:hypothetical protein
MNNKLQLTSYESRGTGHEARKNAASALIIAVILTSLLAIIGVMFVMIARVDKMATSAISENKELNSAVEAVVALVSQELVLDVPGMPKGGDYYDYPDANNTWLASLEPYDDSGTYKWRRISDIYNRLDANNLQAIIIPDYQKPSDVGDSNSISSYPADADGDGVADSNWVIIQDMTSNKGKPIYAAVRVIDNGAMINVNTAYKFDPNVGPTDANLIDGSSQLQINLEAFARGSGTDTIDEIDDARNPLSRPLSDYQNEVIWKIEDPCSDYLPFDISDELTIHGRYIIKQKDTITRLKRVWEYAFDRSVGYNKTQPYNNTGGVPQVWYDRAYRHPSEPNRQQYYNMPHISTTYNIDRIIAPDCNKMTNINTADVNALYKSIRKGLLDANCIDANIAAQITVNIIDYRDSDSDVNYFDVAGKRYYGFETQPFISEIAAIIDKTDANKPNKNFYALELYNPFNKSISLSDFVLSLEGGTDISLNGTIDANGYFVISNDLSKFTINTPDTQQSPGLKFSGNYVDTTVPPDGTFEIWDNNSLTLKRTVDGNDIILDFNDTVKDWFTPGNTVYAQRDTNDWHVVYQTMNTTSPGSLGSLNTVLIPGTNYNLSLANDKFVTVGDIARVLTVDPNGMIGVKLAASSERDVRIDLADPNFQQLFKYLTVFDPYNFHPTDANYANETRIKGRININTAPWYVLAQLPWVSQRRGGYDDANLARAIVAYRDKVDLSPNGPDYSGVSGRGTGTGLVGLREEPGFASIGELATVVNNSNKDNYSMNYYILGAESTVDLTAFPDLTPSDNAPDDFEERDVIFARISNLVTVRSDVFTAYILVRIGKDGPQKRVMAVLDRSNVYSPTDKVKIIALHPVPDPR